MLVVKRNYFIKALVLLLVLLLAVSFILVLSQNTERPAVSAYYVAADGNDNNNGKSLRAPFRTIQKAANVAVAGDTVYIREGTYRETVTPANSGTDGKPIMFQAYQNEIVLISGLDAVSTSWTNYSGNIYYTDYAMSMGDKDAVFVDGDIMTYARWPNKTDASPMTNDGAAVDSGNLTSITDTDMPNQAPGWYDGAIVWCIAGAKWTAWGATITDSGKGTVNFSIPGDMGQYLDPGDTTRGDKNYYYLSGKLGLLDVEKEWFYDQEAGRLYLYAPGGLNAGTETVEVKARDQAIDLTGKSYINFKDIDIKGAQMKITGDYNVVDGMTASHIFTHNARGMYHTHPVEDDGIHITGSFNTIINGNFSYSAGNMFLVDQGKNNLISNNFIHHVDLNGCYDCPIRLENTGDMNFTAITHNTIYNTGRSAIHFCRPAIFKWNEVYNTDIVCDDGAPVYCGGDLVNSEIAFNTIHDIYWQSGSRAGVVSGIYMDGGSANCTAHHNLLYNIGQDAAFRFNAPSKGNRYCYNNTTYNTPKDFLKYLDKKIFKEDNNFHNYLPNQFVDAEKHDFRLAEGASAIDKGKVHSPWTDGFAGSAPDKGCYEFNGPDNLSNWSAGATTTPIEPTPVTIPPTAPVEAPVPLPPSITGSWQEADIGTVDAAGSYSGSGTYTVYGSGADCYGISDNCHFIYRQIKGNFSIQTRISDAVFTNEFAQFGLMARNELTSGSIMVSAFWSPSTDYFKTLIRLAADADTGTATESSGNLLPLFARITRAGNEFTTYISTDGYEFIEIKKETIAMGETIYVGLYACSHDKGLARAVFDNVSIQ